MFVMRRITIVALILLTPSTLFAAAPTLAQLFPPGGQRGQTVTVTASGSFSPWPVQAWCDSKDIKIVAAKDSGKLTVSIGADVVPGIYWIRLFNKDGASELRPFFVSNLPEVIELERNDDFKKPQMLPGSAVVSGKLDKSGDVDAFAISAKKGQTLVASLEAFVNLRSPMDGVLQIVSADGFTLAQNHDYRDMDPQIAFPVPKDGTYVVRVFAFPSKADSSIKFAGNDKMIYRLTVTTGAYVDHAFPLAVNKDAKTPVELVGWNILEAAKKVIPSPRTESVADAFHPSLGNAATVRVETHSIAVSQGPISRAKPQAIMVPATLSGKIERPGDVDVYQFLAKKGDKLSFQVESRSLHFPLDAVVRVTDLEGKMLAEASSAKLNIDPSLSFTSPADGAYRIEIRDLHGEGGPRHVYRLRATHSEPDFELTLSADRIPVTPGKPASVTVTINRRNGFAKDVTLSVEGLPMGVKAEAATLRASDKTATLKLSAESAGASGNIQIVGKTADGLVRHATASGAEQGWRTADLWLTAVPAK